MWLRKGAQTGVGFVAASVAAFLLFFWGSWASPFRDPDEGLFGTIAREMVERGDWLTPHFNGLRYLEKPPLYYWLTALTYALFGFSEWGVRLWPALGASATAFLTALLGREVASARVGLAAGILCATSLGVFLQARSAGVELLFTAFLALALLCFLRWTARGGTAPLIGFYSAVALAVMTKGALGLLLPSLVVGGWFLLARPRLRLRALRLWWGMPLVSVVVLPWHLLASRANPGFLSYYLWETHLVRFLQGTGALEDEPSLSTPMFLLVSLVWFLPWSFFLPSAVFVLVRRWRSVLPAEHSGWTVVCLWAGAVLGLFSLSAFKLEHYALPALPALAVLVASLWSHSRPGWLVAIPLAAGCSVVLVGMSAVWLAGSLAPDRLVAGLATFDVYFRMRLAEGSPLPLPSFDVLRRLFLGMAVWLFLGFAAALVAFWKRGERAALGCLLIGTTAFLLTISVTVAEVTPYYSLRGVATALHRLASPEDVILYEGYLENAGGLPFYTGRQIHLLGPQRGDLAFGSRFPEARGLFHSARELQRLWEGPGRVFLVIDRPPEQSAVQGLPPERGHLLILDHGRRLYSNRS